MPHVMRLAPAGWKAEHLKASQAVQPYYGEEAYSVSDKESSSTWAKLIAQVYEVDPLICPRCSAQMRWSSRSELPSRFRLRGICTFLP